MAEAVVGVLIGKLGEALANEAATYGASLLSMEISAIKGLFGEIRKAEGELEIMKSYLHDAEKFNDTNETTAVFVKKIRDLAFRIEDVVDEFRYRVEDDKHGGFAGRMKKKIEHVKIWRRLALELHDINAELEDAAKKRGLYVMPGIERCAGGSERHTRYTHYTSSFAREQDLVGIEAYVEKLKWWLVGDLKERNHKIATVWGMGGVGKTTLVDHVYKIVKVDFDTAAWVTVSMSYKIEDLLKNIAREFGVSVDTRNMEIRSLVDFIRNHLDGKRYILVLDDVWDKDVWIDIMDVFPSNCTSRFVLTSRKCDVASLATSNCEIKLENLEEDNSWKLFCNVAFRNREEKSCPLELQDWAVKFLQKCEGLPLAIACIARLLCCKPQTYSAWKNVYEELELYSTKNMFPGIDGILKVSLEDLSYELKSCFLHCAIFPEDYKMKRRRLIRHWITSGFIKEKENKTLEQVCEGYLNELINRCLLQVVEKNEFGRSKSCRMHDVIRHLALGRAEKEGFGKVYKGFGTFSVDNARRLSIQSTNILPLCQSGITHLRAIYVFKNYVSINWLRSILASCKMLSTLDLEGTQIKMLPNEVFSLFNLQFLCLRNTGIEILPETVGRLQNLQVLDAYGTGLRSLPKNVGKLKKLRYMYACSVLTEGTVRHTVGIHVPRDIRNLTGLHALQSVKASTDALRDIAFLTELRTFSVCDVTSEHFLILCGAILTMSHLIHLSITASNKNEVLPLKGLQVPETLSKLELLGQLEKKHMPDTLKSWSHLKTLTRLSLSFTKLDEESFSSLLVLHGLCFLSLGEAYDGKTLCFCSESFPRLQQLKIWGAWQLNRVEIKDGALESLVMFQLLSCPELKHLPHGIEYLTTLEELFLEDTAVEVVEKLWVDSLDNESNEELKKVLNAKKVIFRSFKDHISARIVF